MLRLSWIIFALVAGGIIIWCAAGGFDPRPAGGPARFLTPAALQWKAANQEDSHSQIKAFITDLDTSSTTIIVRAHTKPDSGRWGLGDEVGDLLLLDPEGYATLTDHDQVLVPLTTFPHIRPGQNEIWVDFADGALISVRINREIFWQGKGKAKTGPLFLTAVLAGKETRLDVLEAAIYKEQD